MYVIKYTSMTGYSFERHIGKYETAVFLYRSLLGALHVGQSVKMTKDGETFFYFEK